MILNTKAIFTTEKNISDTIISRLNLKKVNHTLFDIYTGIREIEEDVENIIFVYISEGNLSDTINYVKENYILQKIILLGFSKILKDQDIKVGDIILPNTFLDETGNNAIFLDYAVGENYDLNAFGLLLNGVSYDMGDKKTHCGSDCNCSNDENNASNFSGDVKDMISYKFLKLLNQEDYEITSVIRSCIKDSEERNNQFFVDNLVNIAEIML